MQFPVIMWANKFFPFFLLCLFLFRCGVCYAWNCHPLRHAGIAICILVALLHSLFIHLTSFLPNPLICKPERIRSICLVVVVICNFDLSKYHTVSPSASLLYVVLYSLLSLNSCAHYVCVLLLFSLYWTAELHLHLSAFLSLLSLPILFLFP